MYAVLLLLLIAIAIVFVVRKETFTSLAPIFNYNPKEYIIPKWTDHNGYPFFPRKIYNELQLQTNALNSFCLDTDPKTYTELCSFENKNEVIIQSDIDLKSESILKEFFDGFTGKTIAFPFGLATKELPDLFVKEANKNEKYTFIALRSGDTKTKKINDLTIEHIIPFFVYEKNLNYTQGLIVTFSLQKEIITIKGVKSSQLTPFKGEFNVEPVTLHQQNTNILDSNGYFSFYNKYGLYSPFRTSETKITDAKDFLKISEGPKIPAAQLEVQINTFNKQFES
jgi:hypothetical protein